MSSSDYGWNIQGCENPCSLATQGLTHWQPACRGQLSKNYLGSSDVLPYVNALDEMRIAPYGGHAEFKIFRNTAKLYDQGAMLLRDRRRWLCPAIEGLACITRLT
jgi:hypothetical protein